MTRAKYFEMFSRILCIFIIMLYLSLVISSSCPPASFPKLLSGPTGDTEITHLDINEESKKLIAVGHSTGLGLSTSQKKIFPFIADFNLERSSSDSLNINWGYTF